MLTHVHRFHGHGSLRYVYKNGTAVRSPTLTIKVTKNPRRQHSRFAVVISKKVHKSAVGRNRMRRRLYEIIRAELPYLTPASDNVLIVFSSELITMPFSDITRTVQLLFYDAGLYKKPK